MIRIHATCLALAAFALAAPAHAQGNDPAAHCRNGTLPFAANDANRLDEAQIR